MNNSYTSILPFILVVLFMAFISSCAPHVIKSTPPTKIKVTTPYKQVPVRDKIPPTQKPYKVMGKKYYPIPSSYGYTEKGIASWYGKKFHGRKTSNGETYDMHDQTAAHKTLPMNTHLLVKNLDNNKETIVRINDRGPFVKGRIIDLSYSVAKQIDMDKKGIARVRITALGEAVSLKRGGKKVERFLPYKNFEEGEFYVQIGAFEERANANRLKAELFGQGKKTSIQPEKSNGRSLYRVQVRAGTTLAEARKTESVLEGRYPGAFVIAR